MSHKHHLDGRFHDLHIPLLDSSPLPLPGSSSSHLTGIFPAASPADPRPCLPGLQSSWLRAVILLSNWLLLEENEYHLILIVLIILQSQHKIRSNLWGKK